MAAPPTSAECGAFYGTMLIAQAMDDDLAEEMRQRQDYWTLRGMFETVQSEDAMQRQIRVESDAIFDIVMNGSAADQAAAGQRLGVCHGAYAWSDVPVSAPQCLTLAAAARKESYDVQRLSISQPERLERARNTFAKAKRLEDTLKSRGVTPGAIPPDVITPRQTDGLLDSCTKAL